MSEAISCPLFLAGMLAVAILYPNDKTLIARVFSDFVPAMPSGQSLLKLYVGVMSAELLIWELRHEPRGSALLFSSAGRHNMVE